MTRQQITALGTYYQRLGLLHQLIAFLMVSTLDWAMYEQYGGPELRYAIHHVRDAHRALERQNVRIAA